MLTFTRKQYQGRIPSILLRLAVLLFVVAVGGGWWAYSAFLQAPHERAILETNQGAFRSIAYSADGKLLASGGDDGNVHVWDAVTGALLHTLEGNENSIMALAFSPQGKALASGSLKGTLRLWDVSTGKETAS